MTESEEFVRDHWDRPIRQVYCDTYAIRFPDVEEWTETGYFEDESGAWADAARLTMGRIEDIRQIEREIGFIKAQIACKPHYEDMVGPWSAEDVRRSARNLATWSR